MRTRSTWAKLAAAAVITLMPISLAVAPATAQTVTVKKSERSPKYNDIRSVKTSFTEKSLTFTAKIKNLKKSRFDSASFDFFGQNKADVKVFTLAVSKTGSKAILNVHVAYGMGTIALEVCRVPVTKKYGSSGYIKLSVPVSCLGDAAKIQGTFHAFGKSESDYYDSISLGKASAKGWVKKG